MNLLGLIIIFAGKALAAPCPSPAGVPCTPTDANKKKILMILGEAFEAEREMKAAAIARQKAADNGDAEEAWRLMEVVESHEQVMKDRFDKAIRETEKAYNIGPRTAAGPVALPKDPLGRGAWASGLPAFWNPQVRMEVNEVRRYEMPDGSAHYADGSIDPTKVAGITYPDGDVRIMVQNLRDAFRNDNPGHMAYILHHEARHFDDIVGRGQGGRAEDELRAYTDSVRDAAIFELDTNETDKLIGFKNKNLAIVRSGAPTSFFPDENEELKLSIAYDQAQAELKLFYRRREELRVRAVEAKRVRLAAEARARTLAEYLAAASSCGLDPMMNAHSQTLGFRNGQAVNVYFTEPVTLAQAKAGLLMTRACALGEFGQSEDQQCTDALGAMRANWGDAGFKHGLELDADAGNIDGCLLALRNNGDAPKDMRALNKRVTSYWKDWKVAAKRREMETMREYWRQREETGRRSRGDAEERSGRVPDQNYDLTAPRRALDEARRSHF